MTKTELTTDQRWLISMLELMGPSFDPDNCVTVKPDGVGLLVTITNESGSTESALISVYGDIVDPVTGKTETLVAFRQPTGLGHDRCCVFIGHAHILASLLEAGSGAWLATQTEVKLTD